MERAVRKLELNVTIIEKGKVNSTELYSKAPIEVHFTNIKPGFYTDPIKWEFVKLSANTFALKNELKEGDSSVFLNSKNEFRYGEIIATRIGDLIVTKSIEKKWPIGLEGKSISIVVSPLEECSG